jgi:hypothetical protein
VAQASIKIGASYVWVDPGTLEITARFIEESLGSQVIDCKFSEISGSIVLTIGPNTAPILMSSPGRPQSAV